MPDSPADVVDPEALRIARDEPLAPAVARHPPELSADGSDRGCLRLLAMTGALVIGVPVMIGALVALGRGDLLLPALVAALIGTGLLIRRADGLGASREEGADAGREVRLLGAPETATQFAMTLQPSAEGTGFELADDGHRRVAAMIHRCRARDGMGLGPAGSELRISRLCLDGTRPALDARGADWRAIADWLDARDDAGWAWLAAIACAERDSVGRGVRALSMLDTAGAGELAGRVVADMQAQGLWTARGVLAVRRGDVEAIDRLITDAPPGQLESLTALMAARWRVAPDTAAFDGWLASPEHATAMMAAPMPGADAPRWRAILTHPTLAVAAVGASGLISGRSARAASVARALLGRADARAAIIESRRPHGLEPLVIDAIELLGQTGTIDDMRLLAPWRSVPRVGKRARRSQAELKTWIDLDEQGGGLAIATDAIGGGLSPADAVADGGLSTVQPRGE